MVRLYMCAIVLAMLAATTVTAAGIETSVGHLHVTFGSAGACAALPQATWVRRVVISRSTGGLCGSSLACGNKPETEAEVFAVLKNDATEVKLPHEGMSNNGVLSEGGVVLVDRMSAKMAHAEGLTLWPDDWVRATEVCVKIASTSSATLSTLNVHVSVEAPTVVTQVTKPAADPYSKTVASCSTSQAAVSTDQAATTPDKSVHFALDPSAPTPADCAVGLANVVSSRGVIAHHGGTTTVSSVVVKNVVIDTTPRALSGAAAPGAYEPSRGDGGGVGIIANVATSVVLEDVTVTGGPVVVGLVGHRSNVAIILRRVRVTTAGTRAGIVVRCAGCTDISLLIEDCSVTSTSVLVAGILVEGGSYTSVTIRRTVIDIRFVRGPHSEYCEVTSKSNGCSAVLYNDVAAIGTDLVEGCTFTVKEGASVGRSLSMLKYAPEVDHSRIYVRRNTVSLKSTDYGGITALSRHYRSGHETIVEGNNFVLSTISQYVESPVYGIVVHGVNDGMQIVGNEFHPSEGHPGGFVAFRPTTMTGRVLVKGNTAVTAFGNKDFRIVGWFMNQLTSAFTGTYDIAENTFIERSIKWPRIFMLHWLSIPSPQGHILIRDNTLTTDRTWHTFAEFFEQFDSRMPGHFTFDRNIVNSKSGEGTGMFQFTTFASDVRVRMSSNNFTVAPPTTFFHEDSLGAMDPSAQFLFCFNKWNGAAFDISSFPAAIRSIAMDEPCITPTVPPTPTPSAAASVTPTLWIPTRTTTRTRALTPSHSVVATPSPTATSTAPRTLSMNSTATVALLPTLTRSSSATATVVATQSIAPSASPPNTSASKTPTQSSQVTGTSTQSAVATPTALLSVTLTQALSSTPTATHSQSHVPTNSHGPTATNSKFSTATKSYPMTGTKSNLITATASVPTTATNPKLVTETTSTSRSLAVTHSKVLSSTTSFNLSTTPTVAATSSVARSSATLSDLGKITRTSTASLSATFTAPLNATSSASLNATLSTSVNATFTTLLNATSSAPLNATSSSTSLNATPTRGLPPTVRDSSSSSRAASLDSSAASHQSTSAPAAGSRTSSSKQSMSRDHTQRPSPDSSTAVPRTGSSGAADSSAHLSSLASTTSDLNSSVSSSAVSSGSTAGSAGPGGGAGAAVEASALQLSKQLSSAGTVVITAVVAVSAIIAVLFNRGVPELCVALLILASYDAADRCSDPQAATSASSLPFPLALLPWITVGSSGMRHYRGVILGSGVGMAGVLLLWAAALFGAWLVARSRKSLGSVSPAPHAANAAFQRALRVVRAPALPLAVAAVLFAYGAVSAAVALLRSPVSSGDEAVAVVALLVVVVCFVLMGTVVLFATRVGQVDDDDESEESDDDEETPSASSDQSRRKSVAESLRGWMVPSGHWIAGAVEEPTAAGKDDPTHDPFADDDDDDDDDSSPSADRDVTTVSGSNEPDDLDIRSQECEPQEEPRAVQQHVFVSSTGKRNSIFMITDPVTGKRTALAGTENDTSSAFAPTASPGAPSSPGGETENAPSMPSFSPLRSRRISTYEPSTCEPIDGADATNLAASGADSMAWSTRYGRASQSESHSPGTRRHSFAPPAALEPRTASVFALPVVVPGLQNIQRSGSVAVDIKCHKTPRFMAADAKAADDVSTAVFWRFTLCIGLVSPFHARGRWFPVLCGLLVVVAALFRGFLLDASPATTSGSGDTRCRVVLGGHCAVMALLAVASAVLRPFLVAARTALLSVTCAFVAFGCAVGFAFVGHDTTPSLSVFVVAAVAFAVGTVALVGYALWEYLCHRTTTQRVLSPRQRVVSVREPTAL